jgi:hypothetical protein
MQKKNKSFMFMVISLSLYSTLSATTWYVHPDSTLNSIQAALDSCVAYDTVLVAAGTYYENIIWPDINGIKLIGAGRDSSFIDGNNLASVLRFETADIIDTMTIIKGFTITNGNALPPWPESQGGGIYLYYSSPLIDSLNIIGNTADDFGGGMYIWGSSAEPLIRNVIIADNTAISRGGIDCLLSDPTFDHVTVVGNDPGGAYFDTREYPLIVNSIFAFNTYYGVRTYGTSFGFTTIAIAYSDIDDGISAIGYSGVDTTEPIINTNPLFVDANNNDFHLLEGSPCIDAGDPNYPYDPDSTITDMGVFNFHQTGVTSEHAITQPAENHDLGATIISGPMTLPEGKQYIVYDIMGRVVEPNRLQPGIYFIEVDGSVTQKVVKVR